MGGVPFDITEYALINAFKAFGNVKIEWPGKETVPSQPKGYLYVIFEHEKQVGRKLISIKLLDNGSHYNENIDYSVLLFRLSFYCKTVSWTIVNALQETGTSS